VSRVRVGLRLAILPALVVGALLLAWRFGYFHLAGPEQLLGIVARARHNPLAEPLYVIAFTVIATLGLPITVLSILGGALFGTLRGVVLAWIAAMLATVAAYVLARSVGQDSVRRYLGRHHLLNRLNKRSDFWALVGLRNLPVAPFAVLNYLAGLVGISLRLLLLATGIGTLPTLVAYAYAGAELVTGLEQAGPARLRAFWIAGGVTVVMIGVWLLPRGIRHFRGA
jgi:uncharacterized membrane protein YdjX (TVP38/TMEM64 family)